MPPARPTRSARHDVVRVLALVPDGLGREDLGETNDGGDRRAEIVAHVVQERRLEPEEFLGALLRPDVGEVLPIVRDGLGVMSSVIPGRPARAVCSESAGAVASTRTGS